MAAGKEPAGFSRCLSLFWWGFPPVQFTHHLFTILSKFGHEGTKGEPKGNQRVRVLEIIPSQCWPPSYWLLGGEIPIWRVRHGWLSLANHCISCIVAIIGKRCSLGKTMNNNFFPILHSLFPDHTTDLSDEHGDALIFSPFFHR